jgi:hypothetical protein
MRETVHNLEVCALAQPVRCQDVRIVENRPFSRRDGADSVKNTPSHPQLNMNDQQLLDEIESTSNRIYDRV